MVIFLEHLVMCPFSFLVDKLQQDNTVFLKYEVILTVSRPSISLFLGQSFYKVNTCNQLIQNLTVCKTTQRTKSN